MNLEKIQQELRNQRLDGWLFFDHHVRDPLAYRVLGFTAPRIPTRRWYYFVPSAGEPSKLVHRIEAGMLDSLPGTKYPYSSWSEQTEGVKTLLQGARRVAMQYSPLCAIPYVAMVDAGTIELVRSLGAEVVSSADLIQQFEARWTPEAFQTHLEAGRRVDRIRQDAFGLAAERVNSGTAVTEYEIQQFILTSFRDQGLFTDHGPIVAVNGNASNPHYEPTREVHSPIGKGDLLLIDLWAKLDQPGAVYYDITWTGFFGDPSDEMLRVFDVVKGARDRAIDRVQQGIASGDGLAGYQVDDAARSFITDQGFGQYFTHRTGHSIGEDVHGSGANMDNLETHDERRVLAGTCFSIEPGIYLPEFGIRSEVNMYIEDQSARVTGEIQTALLRL